MTDEQGGAPLGYGLVANVAQETTAHGEGGPEVCRGLKHFAPGAGLRITPERWQHRGNAVAVGRHRGNGRRHVALVTGLRYRRARFNADYARYPCQPPPVEAPTP